LCLRPGVADRRHRPPRAGEAVAEDALQPRLLREQRVVGDRRGVAALPEVAVASRADAVPDLLADRLLPGREVVPVGPLRVGLDSRAHGSVEYAAELSTLAVVAPGRVRPEPEVVDPARDRLDLAAERRDPPAVDDVRRHDLEVYDRAHGDVERPDRTRLVRGVGVVELPVVLVALDRDVDRLGRGRRGADGRE